MLISERNPRWEIALQDSSERWVWRACGYELYKTAYEELREREYFIVDNLLSASCLPQNWRITTRIGAIGTLLRLLVRMNIIYSVRNREYTFNRAVRDNHVLQRSPFTQYANYWQLHGPRLLNVISKLPDGQFTFNQLVDEIDWGDFPLQSRVSKLNVLSKTMPELIGRGAMIRQHELLSVNRKFYQRRQ